MNQSLLLDIQSALMTLTVMMPRVAVCLGILPGFSGPSLSAMVRGAVAAAVALPAAPPLFAAIQASSPDYLLLLLLCCKEAALGGMLGLLLSIPVWTAQSIGSIIDAQRAPIANQGNNASLDRDASLIGGLLQQAVMLVLMQAGLFLALVRILVESYGLWPAFSMTPPVEIGHFDELLKRLGEFFWHTALYGGPVIIVLVMVDFGFAMIGVFASNLQVSFASAPIKCLVGLVVLLLYWPTLSHYVAGDFAHMLDFTSGFLDAGRAAPAGARGAP